MRRPADTRARASARGRAAHALAVACAVSIGAAGCAARQTIVLIPDPDGRVGQAEVATAGGTQVLTKASDMTRVGRPSAPPSAVTTADAGYVATTFAEAMAVEPAPPDRYVLFFETGTTTLDAKSLSAIPAIAAAAARRAAISVAVSGHTDATGSDATNEKLAQARAERVRALLVERGIAPALMTVSSHGKGNPAVPTPDGVPEPRNRRVEVVVQ